jgi:hypothetical protein
MEPTLSTREQEFVAELGRRRAELLESMRALEQALAAPTPGRRTQWAERVHVSLVELSGDFRAHLEVTEGPDGLYSQLLTTAPRLAGASSRLAREHVVIHAEIDDLLATAGAPDAAENVDAIRESGTALLARLVRHRQQGSDLVYEAYHSDIGGET